MSCRLPQQALLRFVSLTRRLRLHTNHLQSHICANLPTTSNRYLPLPVGVASQMKSYQEKVIRWAIHFINTGLQQLNMQRHQLWFSWIWDVVYLTCGSKAWLKHTLENPRLLKLQHTSSIWNVLMAFTYIKFFLQVLSARKIVVTPSSHL